MLFVFDMTGGSNCDRPKQVCCLRGQIAVPRPAGRSSSSLLSTDDELHRIGPVAPAARVVLVARTDTVGLVRHTDLRRQLESCFEGGDLGTCPVRFNLVVPRFADRESREAGNADSADAPPARLAPGRRRPGPSRHFRRVRRRTPMRRKATRLGASSADDKADGLTIRIQFCCGFCSPRSRGMWGALARRRSLIRPGPQAICDDLGSGLASRWVMASHRPS